MADAVTVKITGLEELREKLESLGPKLMKKVVRGLKEAGEDFVAAFAENAPKDSGFLSEHFAAKIVFNKVDALRSYVRVGPTTDKYVNRGKSALPASVVAEILEFGRAPKGQGRSRAGGLGKRRFNSPELKTAINPFMSQTFEQLKEYAGAKIETAIRESLAESIQGSASTAIAKSLQSIL